MCNQMLLILQKVTVSAVSKQNLHRKAILQLLYSTLVFTDCHPWPYTGKVMQKGGSVQSCAIVCAPDTREGVTPGGIHAPLSVWLRHAFCLGRLLDSVVQCIHHPDAHCAPNTYSNTRFECLVQHEWMKN